jgi:chloramphenicol-sensitive protein RarD
LFPLYFRLLVPAGALEILGHRVVWSLVFLTLVLLVRRRWSWVRVLTRNPRRLGLLLLAATVIAINWGVYIWAVNTGHVVEASLGYFINPLVTVLIGIVAFRERLRHAQWAAVSLGGAAVLVLTVGYGRPPWVGLVLALSFATYGVVKKVIGMPALESLSAETVMLILPSLAFLGWLHEDGRATFGHESGGHLTLMVGLGVITAVPLLLFGAAAPRVPLTTLGLLQYITPVMQFALGVLVFDETLTPARVAGFVLVWSALLVFSVDGLRHRSDLPAPPVPATA